MAKYVVDVNDPTKPTNSQGATQGAEEIRALKLKMASIIAGAFVTTGVGANAADLQNYIMPDVNDRPAMVAAGWKPWNLNQQWGGAGCMPFHMVDAATGVEYKFDAFDGNVDSNANNATIGDIAGNFYRYQVITPAKNIALQAVWIKIFKNGNPVDNVTLQLYSVAAGVPGALIATANVINGKQITSDTNGQWYRLSFAVVQNLIAGTQYTFVVSKSAGVDPANFYTYTYKSPTKFPNNLHGQGTVAPVWTASNTATWSFLCEAQTSDQAVQSAGTFNGRLVGSGTGNPINRSVGYCNEIRNVLPLFNPNGWSISLRGKSWTKDTTFAEFTYGLHHDRINIRSTVGTGLTTVTIYKQDGTIISLSGTSDISTATFKDIWIVGRSMGDGGDYLKIYIGNAGIWSKEAELVGQTITFDPLMFKLGTAWILGGFPLFGSANYTNLADMSVLPSAAPGYTFTTTTGTVEANVFAVSGGKLNQIKAGMAAGGDGYYVHTAAGFANANGWFLSAKARVINGTNTKDQTGSVLQVQDGTKGMQQQLEEYYFSAGSTAQYAYPQVDLKSNDNTYFITGKGSDVLHFNNGKFIIDATGLLTAASGGNTVTFGDISTVANENNDVAWDYVGYYNTSNIYPQFTSGELHEFACFSGDKNLLGQAVYNLGVPLSIKQYCGIAKNYLGEQLIQSEEQQGITFNPVNASASLVLIPEMERFILGSYIQFSHTTRCSHNTINAALDNYSFIDGVQQANVEAFVQEATANNSMGVSLTGRKKLNFGLHKIEQRGSTNVGQITYINGIRNLSLDVRP